MPGYWFMYNMYALERNAWKYVDRDRRTHKIQQLEYDYLAPDTINEMFTSLNILQALQPDENGTAFIEGWENTQRITEILKVPQAIQLFKELIQYYGTLEILKLIQRNKFSSFADLKKALSAKIQRTTWLNIGGQLMPEDTVKKMIYQVKKGQVKSWHELHDFYKVQGELYAADKLSHAYTALLEVLGITPRQFTPALLQQLLQQLLVSREWMVKGIYESRAKDYTNPFRKMVYDTEDEMNTVLGKLEDNSFIQQQYAALDELKKQVKSAMRKFKNTVA
jgi:hypothetical protein